MIELNGCHEYSVYDSAHDRLSAKANSAGKNSQHKHGWIRFQIQTDIGSFDGKIASTCSNRMVAPICGTGSWRWIEHEIPYNGKILA